MNGKPRFITLGSLIVTLAALLLVASPAFASPVSAKKAQLRRLQARLQTVYRQADIAVEKYNQATSQLKTVKGKIRQNERQLKITEYNLEIANQHLLTRAENMYRTLDVGALDVLFAAKSFDELITQLDMMERLGNSDVDTIKSIAAYRQDIRDRRVKLAADKKAADKLVATAAEHKAEIQAVQGKLERMTAGVKADITRLQRQAAARAQAAAEAAAAQQSDDTSGGGSSGGGTVVDPGGSGHSSVVAIAQRYLRVPYVYGGASPSGFDCSGLTMYCYAQIGIGLSHGATDQQRASRPVPLSALQPGDLVFFGSASYSHHVGIYVGGGSMIHAPHTGAVVSYGGIGGAWIGGRP